jgi:anaerobic magnesium-protoporphyrin IX monomethyl ester cyclase
MSFKKVVFIAHLDQENLGVDYLSSMLISTNTVKDVEIIDLRLSNDEICQRVKKADPLMVGFSLIFQYHAFQLRDLAKYLRENGVHCHFTIGGHYPSLRYEDILNLIPELDSVVRFEGEHTICELAESLITGKDWTKIKGVAYRKDGKPISNELRPLISDLDILPFPFRNKEKRYQCMDKDCAFLIASRGCVWNCSFCSIKKFYQIPPGRLRRSRSPANVVAEIVELYEKQERRIFLFQDDDFLPVKIGRNWVLDFIDELENKGLADKILWKINCRTDEVDSNLFARMKKCGLCLVYLGIESGTQKGLDILNKQLSVEDNLRAVEILNRLKILYDYGFMLFDPSSTFESVLENIRFLRKICGDGSSPIVFCKTIPYAETDIEKRLVREGRLKGSIINPDYSLLNPKVDRFCEFLHRIFHEQLFTYAGLSANLRWHRLELAVLKKFYPHAKGIPEYEEFLREIIASYTSLFFDFVEKTAKIFERGSYNSEKQLQQLVEYMFREFAEIKSKLQEGMVEFQKQQQ